MTATKAPFETHHHVVPISVYVRVILTLIALMALTVWASFWHFETIGPVSGTIIAQSLALIIAITKATLVIMYFMGVRWATQLTKFWAILGFVWLSFFGILVADYGMRHFEDVQGWDKQAGSALPRTLEPDNAPNPEPNAINIRPRG